MVPKCCSWGIRGSQWTTWKKNLNWSCHQCYLSSSGGLEWIATLYWWHSSLPPAWINSQEQLSLFFDPVPGCCCWMLWLRQSWLKLNPSKTQDIWAVNLGQLGGYSFWLWTGSGCHWWTPQSVLKKQVSTVAGKFFFSTYARPVIWSPVYLSWIQNQWFILQSPLE